jgi:hypothetical protein
MITTSTFRVGEQVAVIGVHGRAFLRRLAVGPRSDTPEPPVDAGRHRIGERDHLRAVDVVEVEDVLAPHHPAADHAVPDGVAHAPTVLRRPTHRSVRELFRRAALAAH